MPSSSRRFEAHARPAGAPAGATPAVAGSRPVAAAAAPAASRWILAPWQDLLLFVGTPVLVLPAVLIAERLWSGRSLYALVMAFGALGHHLPGMMRAYGDRALFARFRTRFIVAPLFFVGLCFGFTLHDPARSPILLVTYVWGVWHGLMQTHGFLRIYDAKVQSFATRTARLDMWMCIAWFGAGMLFSSNRVHHILQKLYASGGPAVPVEVVHNAQLVWAALTAVVTLAYVSHGAQAWRAGRPPSPVKLGLLATSLGFWWYANAVVDNILVGLVLFEIFHDVQYLSIVWIYNRRRVQTDPGVGGFTRFVFRDRRALLVLYVGLVFAYGALSLVPKLPSATVGALFTSILAASTLLHFYFDSFIWKVKEKPTRAALGLQGGEDIRTVRRGLPVWVPQGLRWAALVVPVAFLAVTSSSPSLSQDQAMLTLGRTFPDYALAQNNLAVYLLSHDDPEGALEVSRGVLARRPRDPEIVAKAHENLSWALLGTGLQRLQRGRTAEAEALLREAAGLDAGLGRRLGDMAAERARSGDRAGAILHRRAAVLAAPDDARLQAELAETLAQHGRLDEALEHARRACDLDPADAAARRLLSALEAARAGR